MHKELYNTRRYYKLIDFYRHKTVEGYTEKHHIVPRCMGGTDDEYNIVRLPAKAHYLAHLLLTKMYPAHKGLLLAYSCMSVDPEGNGERSYTARQYTKMKKANAASKSKAVTIDGIEFESRRAAAKHYGVSDTTICNWIKRHRGKSAPIPKTKRKMSCVVDGIEFDSHSSAAKHFGVTRKIVTRWIYKCGGKSQPVMKNQHK